MKHSLPSLVLAAALLVAAPLTHASLIHLHADLIGANEFPPVVSAGTGFGDFDLDTTAQTLHGHIVFSGLTGTTTASHIHCCLASPFLMGVNAGVATAVPFFLGFPIGVTSGVYDLLVADLTSPSFYNPAFVTAQGGLANAEAAFIAGLTSGRTYLNIHTTFAPGGEIRGFVAVPEPMTISLLVLGLAAAGFVSRRHRRI
jgi:hypothetical protein